MKKNFINTVLLIVILVLAVILGKIIGDVCADTSWLFWLNAGANIGLEPTTLNLQVIQLTLGAVVKINAAQAILLLAGISFYIIRYKK